MIWPVGSSKPSQTPLLLVGGTLDLITPPLDEQIGLLASLGQHPSSRVVVVEGASHFSPIRVGESSISTREDDLFQLGEDLVGVNPRIVQRIIANEIVVFLSRLSIPSSVSVDEHMSDEGIRWHRLTVEGAVNLYRRYQ